MTEYNIADLPLHLTPEQVASLLVAVRTKQPAHELEYVPGDTFLWVEEVATGDILGVLEDLDRPELTKFIVRKTDRYATIPLATALLLKSPEMALRMVFDDAAAAFRLMPPRPNR